MIMLIVSASYQTWHYTKSSEFWFQPACTRQYNSLGDEERINWEHQKAGPEGNSIQEPEQWSVLCQTLTPRRVQVL